MRLKLMSVNEQEDTSFKVTIKQEVNGKILIQGGGTTGHKWNICAFVVKDSKVQLELYRSVVDDAVNNGPENTIFVTRIVE